MTGSQKVLRQLKTLKEKLERFVSIERQWEDVMTLNQLAEEEEDASVLDEVTKGIDDIGKRLSELKLETLLSGQYDRNNAIITLHAGAGGTEAQDWVEMLLRMYTRWCERRV